MRAGSRACSRGAAQTSQQFFATSAGAVGPAARRAVRRRLRPGRRCSGCCPRLGRRRSRLRHRRGAADAGAARRARHWRRRVGRDARGRARARLQDLTNVELRRGALEALPLDDASLDAATMMLVLHHLPAPALRAGRSRARAQARRPAADRRHDVARARGIPAADGPRLARIFGRTDAPAARPGRLRATSRFARCRRRPKPKGRRCSRRARDEARTRRFGHSERQQPGTNPEPRTNQGASRCPPPVATEHAFDLARKAGRLPYKVADLAPRRVGPQGNAPGRAGDARPDGAARALRGQEAAGRRARHGLAAHDDSDRRCSSRRSPTSAPTCAGSRATSSRRRITRPRPSSSAVPRRAARAEHPRGIPVFAWKGETLDEYWWCTTEALRVAGRLAARR